MTFQHDTVPRGHGVEGVHLPYGSVLLPVLAGTGTPLRASLLHVIWLKSELIFPVLPGQRSPS